jgi:hypothetical protein
MTDFIWQHILGPAVGGVFGIVPFWAWIILAGLLLGWAWKQFGWQGLAGAAVAVLTLGVYRKGWKDRDSLSPEHVDPGSPDAILAPKKPKATSKPDLPDSWLAKVKRGQKL